MTNTENWSTILVAKRALRRTKDCHLSISDQAVESYVEACIAKAGLNQKQPADPDRETILKHWIEQRLDGLLRFFDRAERDHRMLSSLGGCEPGSQIVGVDPSRGDDHNGKAPFIVTFESGLKVVYKPRPVALDDAYARVLRWYNQCTGSSLGWPRVIQRPGYGWVQFIESRPCDHLEEVKTFFRQSGNHLCLIYLMEGADVHQTNVIADRGRPYLIDLECLFHPRLDEDVGNRFYMLNGTTYDQIFDSVLRTGLLRRPGVAKDCTGLSNVERSKEEPSNPDSLSRSSNLPILNGIAESPGDYVSEIEQGFTETYEFVGKNRNSLIGDDGILGLFAGLRSRFILRSTPFYRRLISQVLDNRSFVQQQREDLLPKLVSPWGQPSSHPLRPILDVECRALSRLDVPRLTGWTDRRGLVGNSGRTVLQHLVSPALPIVRKRIGSMSKQTLDDQLRQIRIALE